jgi:aryl carrier-like protein
MIRIVTFKYGTKYTVEHVVRLRNMLRRNLKIPYEFVLVTDDKNILMRGIDGVRVIPLWEELRDARNCGVRLRLFAADAAKLIGLRFAWIDLDVVIVGDVTEFFNRPEPFVICATPRPPLFYNGSIVMMDAGARSQIYEDYTPGRYEREGRKYGTVSDEGWIGARLGPGEATWDKTHGLYYYRNHIEPAGGALPGDARIVLMNAKNYDPSFPHLQRKSPWIARHWQ